MCKSYFSIGTITDYMPKAFKEKIAVFTFSSKIHSGNNKF